MPASVTVLVAAKPQVPLANTRTQAPKLSPLAIFCTCFSRVNTLWLR